MHLVLMFVRLACVQIAVTLATFRSGLQVNTELVRSIVALGWLKSATVMNKKETY